MLVVARPAMNLKAMRLGMLKMKACANVEAINTKIKPSRVLRLPNLGNVENVNFEHHVQDKNKFIGILAVSPRHACG